jgi:hypothetical protein
MSENIWIAIVGALGAAFGGVGAKWVEKQKLLRNKREAAKHRNRLYNILVVYKAIEEIVSQGYADRAILFIGSNGGARPRPGHVYQVSAIHAACSKDTAEDLLDRYKIVRVDAHYIEILLRLLDSKDQVKFTDTASMSEGRLKDIYISEGVKSANIYYLGHSEEELYLCSFGSFNKSLDDVPTKNALSLYVDAMRHSFNLYSIKEF